MITVVRFSRRAEKEIPKVPGYIQKKLRLWVSDIESQGLSEVQKIPGYHDEPLKGVRQGQRSVRLNKAYRAIYTVKDDGKIEFLFIEEVSKHDY